MKKNILITGGAGFVGSNLAVFLKNRLKDYEVVCFDNLIRKGSKLNVARLKDANIPFVSGDIRNKRQLFALERIAVIIDCAAEPSVLAAYNDPNCTIDTNLIGTVNCLSLARRENAGFIFLSTSRVYPIKRLEQIPYKEFSTRFDWEKDISGPGFTYKGITHEFALDGIRSLYGASKLCAEQILAEYFDMFSLKGVINRLGIIAGPWQMGKVDQGIISFWIAKHKYRKDLQYLGFGGSGKQVRDAIHIDDVCHLLLYEINNLKNVHAKIFNVGGGRKNSFSLIELTGRIQELMKTKTRIHPVKIERKSDMRIYITDNSEVTKQTKWLPQKNLDDILRDTHDWINYLADNKKVYEALDI